MEKYKKFGYTLSELLIVLIIIGVITTLVLPSLLKDVQEKSRMNALTSTVDNLQKAVDIELANTRAQNLFQTQILNTPSSFWDDNFELAADNAKAFVNSYSAISSNNTINLNGVQAQRRVLLKNGVGILLVYTAGTNDFRILIDVNGAEKPNIIGRDLFSLQIQGSEDPDNASHLGNVASVKTHNNFQDAKNACKRGDAAACYRAAELSGFNPKYLDD